MKQLSKIQQIIYLIGATLMAAGAGMSVLGWAVAPYLYCVGALCFASMQMLQRYEGTNFTIKRLDHAYKRCAFYARRCAHAHKRTECFRSRPHYIYRICVQQVDYRIAHCSHLTTLFFA